MSHRKNHKYLIHLLNEEWLILDEKAQDHFLSKSCFIREMIINNAIQKGFIRFGREAADKLQYEINRISNNIHQIAYQSHISLNVDENDFSCLLDDYKTLLAHWENWVME